MKGWDWPEYIELGPDKTYTFVASKVPAQKYMNKKTGKIFSPLDYCFNVIKLGS